MNMMNSTDMNKHILLTTLLFIFALPIQPAQAGKCVSGDCWNGWGTGVYSNGEKYKGKFSNGRPDGPGTYTWPNGSKYVGEHRNGNSDGQGTYTWSDGNKYVGEFRNDRKHGQGIYTFFDGRKYVVEYNNGKSVSKKRLHD